MTWTQQTTIVTAGTSKIAGTSIATGAQAGYLPVIGDVIVVVIPLDNQDITQGVDSSLVTSVTDTKGNTYTKLHEHTAGRGVALAGVTTSLWACLNVTSAWASSDTITVNHGSTTARAVRACAFTPSNATGASLDATKNQSVGIAADPASMSLTPSGGNREYLWLYMLGAEGPTSDTDTADTTNGWAQYFVTGTTGGGAASNVTGALGWKVATASSATVDWTHTAEDYAQVIVALTENTATVSPVLVNADPNYNGLGRVSAFLEDEDSEHFDYYALRPDALEAFIAGPPAVTGPSNAELVAADPNYNGLGRVSAFLDDEDSEHYDFYTQALDAVVGLLAPAVTLSNTHEGGSDGTLITTGNSGGASGDAYDVVTQPSGSNQRLAFSDEQAGGSFAADTHYQKQADTNEQFGWTTKIGSQNRLFIRYYLYLTTTPTTNNLLPQIDVAGTTSDPDLLLGAAGQLVLENSTGSNRLTSQVLPTEKWIRVEVMFHRSVSGKADAALRWYADPNSSTPTENLATGNTETMGSADYIGVLFAPTASAATTPSMDMYIDDVAVSTEDWPGRSATTFPTTERPSLTFYASILGDGTIEQTGDVDDEHHNWYSMRLDGSVEALIAGPPAAAGADETNLAQPYTETADAAWSEDDFPADGGFDYYSGRVGLDWESYVVTRRQVLDLDARNMGAFADLDPVEDWTDIVEGHHFLRGSHGQPQYRSAAQRAWSPFLDVPAVYFDGGATNDQLDGGNLAPIWPNAVSFFVAFRPLDDPDGRYSVFGNNDNDSWWMFTGALHDSYFGPFRTVRLGPSFPDFDTFSPSGYFIVGIVASGSVYNVFVNGLKFVGTPGTYDPGTKATLGATDTDAQGQDRGLTGLIAHVRAFNYEMTDQEAQDAITALSQIWTDPGPAVVSILEPTADVEHDDYDYWLPTYDGAVEAFIAGPPVANDAYIAALDLPDHTDQPDEDEAWDFYDPFIDGAEAVLGFLTVEDEIANAAQLDAAAGQDDDQLWTLTDPTDIAPFIEQAEAIVGFLTVEDEIAEAAQLDRSVGQDDDQAWVAADPTDVAPFVDGAEAILGFLTVEDEIAEAAQLPRDLGWFPEDFEQANDPTDIAPFVEANEEYLAGPPLFADDGYAATVDVFDHSDQPAPDDAFDFYATTQEGTEWLIGFLTVEDEIAEAAQLDRSVGQDDDQAWTLLDPTDSAPFVDGAEAILGFLVPSDEVAQAAQPAPDVGWFSDAERIDDTEEQSVETAHIQPEEYIAGSTVADDPLYLAQTYYEQDVENLWPDDEPISGPVQPWVEQVEAYTAGPPSADDSYVATTALVPDASDQPAPDEAFDFYAYPVEASEWFIGFLAPDAEVAEAAQLDRSVGQDDDQLWTLLDPTDIASFADQAEAVVAGPPITTDEYIETTALVPDHSDQPAPDDAWDYYGETVRLQAIEYLTGSTAGDDPLYLSQSYTDPAGWFWDDPDPWPDTYHHTPLDVTPWMYVPLRLWLDATQITGKVDGDPVPTFVDATGLGNNAVATGAGQEPFYVVAGLNGLPVIQVDGIDDGMVVNGQVFRLNEPATIYVVARRVAGVPAGPPAVWARDQNNDHAALVDGLDNTGFHWLQTETGTTPAVGSLDPRVWQIHTVRIASASQLDAWTFEVGPITIDPDDSAINGGGLALFYRPGNSGRGQFALGELRAYGSAHTTTERLAVLAELAAKWFSVEEYIAAGQPGEAGIADAAAYDWEGFDYAQLDSASSLDVTAYLSPNDSFDTTIAVQPDPSMGQDTELVNPPDLSQLDTGYVEQAEGYVAGPPAFAPDAEAIAAQPIETGIDVEGRWPEWDGTDATPFLDGAEWFIGFTAPDVEITIAAQPTRAEDTAVDDPDRIEWTEETDPASTLDLSPLVRADDPIEVTVATQLDASVGQDDDQSWTLLDPTDTTPFIDEQEELIAGSTPADDPIYAAQTWPDLATTEYTPEETQDYANDSAVDLSPLTFPPDAFDLTIATQLDPGAGQDDDQSWIAADPTDIWPFTDQLEAFEEIVLPDEGIAATQDYSDDQYDPEPEWAPESLADGAVEVLASLSDQATLAAAGALCEPAAEPEDEAWPIYLALPDQSGEFAATQLDIALVAALDVPVALVDEAEPWHPEVALADGIEQVVVTAEIAVTVAAQPTFDAYDWTTFEEPVADLSTIERRPIVAKPTAQPEIVDMTALVDPGVDLVALKDPGAELIALAESEGYAMGPYGAPAPDHVSALEGEVEHIDALSDPDVDVT